MNTTYDIRLEAIAANLTKDGDHLKYNRELSRLEIDVTSHLRRCQKTEDSCTHLETLLDNIDNKLRGDAQC